VTVKTAKGEILAAFTTPLPIPKTEPPHRPDYMNKSDGQLTTEEKYLRRPEARSGYQSQKRLAEYYEKALADDAGYAPALAGSGRARYGGRLYEEAIKRLEKAFCGIPATASLVLPGRELPLDAQAGEALRCAGRRPGARDAFHRFRSGRPGPHGAGRAACRLNAFQLATRLNPRDGPGERSLAVWPCMRPGTRAVAYKYLRRYLPGPTDLVPRARWPCAARRKCRLSMKEARDFVGEDEFEMLETSLAFADHGGW